MNNVKQLALNIKFGTNLLISGGNILHINLLTTNGSPSYRNQSIDLHSKSIDWFLYDGEHLSLMS